VHSPFLFNLITNVFEDKIKYEDYEPIENLKQQLIHNKKEIEITDLGAGSKKGIGNKRTISQIAKHSSKPKDIGRLLYRLSSSLKPSNILELGTSFGLSTAYMALGNPASKITTIEGCPNISSIACNNFDHLNITNIKLCTGNFDDVLPGILETLPEINLGFIDGNHKKEPTIRYFEQCLAKTANDSCLIFDDIHWSDEMEQAWYTIIQNKKVTLSVDLFHIGLVFFKKELTKQDFVIRF
jgi:predicted O-methyltransferase YrrM